MEILTLSLKTASSLEKLNGLIKEADGMQRLKQICKYILQIVVSGNPSAPVSGDDEELLTAISTIIFEAARLQLLSTQLSSSLNELNIKDDIKDMITALYDEHRETFIQHLSSIGITMPEIVDVEWRLDYVVRSKQGGRENYPLFLITLLLKDRGLLRNVSFTATQEELQDLLSKVRDGVKQVDRILNTKDK